MSVAVTITEQWFDGKRLHVEGTLAASGSYVTGGDTVSLAGLPIRRPPAMVLIQGQAGYAYRWVPGTGLTDGKMKVFRGAASGQEFAEHSAATYDAAVSADVIKFSFASKQV